MDQETFAPMPQDSVVESEEKELESTFLDELWIVEDVDEFKNLIPSQHTLSKAKKTEMYFAYIGTVLAMMRVFFAFMAWALWLSSGEAYRAVELDHCSGSGWLYQLIVGKECELYTQDPTAMMSPQCGVSEGEPVSGDLSWQCMVTPCNECGNEECRAQCCNQCLTQVCGASQDSAPHFRRVCLGCDYLDSALPTWDLPSSHKTELKTANHIQEINDTDKFDVGTCKKLVAPVPPAGATPDLEEELCRLSVYDYTKNERCTDLLSKWESICGLPIDGDACALRDDLLMDCSTAWSCTGGNVLCSLYEARYDSLLFDCRECSEPLRFKCCEECFGVMDKQEFEEPDNKSVTCAGCHKYELAAVKTTPFSTLGQSKVDSHAGKLDCKYEDGCTTGKVANETRDSSWKCVVTTCDECGNNVTAKALCCVECLRRTCTRDGRDPVRRVCTGCDELPKSTATTTYMPVGTTPKPSSRVLDVNVSDEMDMSFCMRENNTNLTVEEVLGDKPPAGREKDVENCTTSPQLQCSGVTSLLAIWNKNYNTLRHDLSACTLESGHIKCLTSRKCRGGHTYCFLAASVPFSINYDCSNRDMSELQRHSCCAVCNVAEDKAAAGTLKDENGISYGSVFCKGCGRDALSNITDRSCSAATTTDYCRVNNKSDDFNCTFREAYGTGKKVLESMTGDLSWQCTTTPCDVCSMSEEGATQEQHDRLRSQCCVKCLTAASKTCHDNRTRNICQGCQEEEADRIAQTTSKEAAEEAAKEAAEEAAKEASVKADIGFLGLSKASSSWSVAGFVGLLAFAALTFAAMVRRFPNAGVAVPTDEPLE